MLARSEDSAARARERVAELLARAGSPDAGAVTVTTEPSALQGARVVVEAVAEDLAIKAAVLREADVASGGAAILATTTSSLSIEELAAAFGAPERFAGLHVFNPVPRMELVEVTFPAAAADGTRAGILGLCAACGKQAVVTPDVPGFVVNRLLFPYLFSAVELLAETGLTAQDVDRCMTLGAGHPMGPLELLDLVGLDIAAAIGEAIGHPAPAALIELVAQGALGRKSGAGFHHYAAPPATAEAVG